MKKHADSNQDAREQQLRQHHRQTLSTLAGGVAHELNNILAGLSGYSRLLQDNLGDETVRKRAISCFHRGLQRASEIARRIGHFACLDEPDWDTVNLVPIIQDVVNAVDEDLSHHGIQIYTSFGELPTVLVDVSLFSTALLELVQNAKEALITSDSNEKTITVVTRMEDTEAVILVMDTGDGLPGEYEDADFQEPFLTTKGPLSTGDFPNAQGLGLSCAYGIAQELNGTLMIRNREEKGAEVRLSLPAASPLFDRKKGRILIVDDEAAIRRIFTTMLERAGYSTYAAEDAAGGLSMLEEFDIDLILLDQMMPGMSGLQFLERIREAMPAPPPVVMITAGYSPDLARKAIELGASACTAKPINRHKILHFAKSYTEKHQNVTTAAALPPVDGMPQELQILIVDPDPLSGEAFELILKHNGHRCTCVNDSVSAVLQAEQQYFDIIIMDLMLHDADGPKTIHKLRLLAPYTPILVTSSRLSTPTMQAAYAAGATHMIQKPIQTEVIFQEVAKLTAIFHERSQPGS